MPIFQAIKMIDGIIHIKKGEKMRIKHMSEQIDYQETKRFFDSRANKYNTQNPYSVTMYQDNNVSLVQRRNEYEINKLVPLLKIEEKSKVLDLACGIGRWSDALDTKKISYCGIDFSEELISIANERSNNPNATFLSGNLIDLDKILLKSDITHFDRILMIGILVYLNDSDLISVLHHVENHCDASTIICIREPIGLDDRLTLKNHYSQELNDNYNAIYRTNDEIKTILDQTLLNKGFTITHEGFLFDDDCLNNRKETAQYYYILER